MQKKMVLVLLTIFLIIWSYRIPLKDWIFIHIIDRLESINAKNSSFIKTQTKSQCVESLS